MNWKYSSGQYVTWQGTHKKIGLLDTGYVVARLEATVWAPGGQPSLGVEYARRAVAVLPVAVLPSLGFDQSTEFFEKKLKTISATSQRDRYLIWIPNATGKSGRFVSPVKSVVEKEIPHG